MGDRKSHRYGTVSSLLIHAYDVFKSLYETLKGLHKSKWPTI